MLTLLVRLAGISAVATVVEVVLELHAEQGTARLVAAHAIGQGGASVWRRRIAGIGRRRIAGIGRVDGDAEAAIAEAPVAAPKLCGAPFARIWRGGGGAARKAERGGQHGRECVMAVHRKFLEAWRSVSIPP